MHRLQEVTYLIGSYISSSISVKGRKEVHRTLERIANLQHNNNGLHVSILLSCVTVPEPSQTPISDYSPRVSNRFYRICVVNVPAGGRC